MNLRAVAPALLVAACAAAYLRHPDPAEPPTWAVSVPAPPVGACETGRAVVDLVGPADAGQVADPGEVFAVAQAASAAAGAVAWAPVDPEGAGRAEGLWVAEGDPLDLALVLVGLRHTPGVEVAECEVRYRALGASSDKPRTWEPDDPLYPRQWHLGLAGAPEAWAESWRLGAGAVVAVLDTGIAPVSDIEPGRLLPGRTYGGGASETFSALAALVADRMQPPPRAAATAATLRQIAGLPTVAGIPLDTASATLAFRLLSVPVTADEPAPVQGRRKTCAELGDLYGVGLGAEVGPEQAPAAADGTLNRLTRGAP